MLSQTVSQLGFITFLGIGSLGAAFFFSLGQICYSLARKGA